MKTALLKKFKKRFEIVKYKGRYVLLDKVAICVVRVSYLWPMDKREYNSYVITAHYRALVEKGLREILGESRFRSLSDRRDYNRRIRFVDKSGKNG